MKKPNLDKIGKFVPVIGLILFIYIIYDIGFGKILESFSLIPIHYYIIATLPFFLKVLLTAYKWKYLCKKQNMDCSFIYLIKIVFISTYYASITPGGLGWFIRIFYLKKKSYASIEKCISNSLIDNITASISGVFLGIIGVYILLPFNPVYSGIFYVLLALLFFYILALVVFIKKSGGGRIFNIFIRPFIPKRYKEKFDRSIDSLYEDIPRLRDMIIPLIIEVVVFIIIGVQVYIIALAFSINIPFHIFLLIHTVSVVAAALIPISVGGLGVREGTFVVLSSPFGIEPYVAFVISFSGFIVKSLIPTFIGLFFSFKEPLQK